MCLPFANRWITALIALVVMPAGIPADTLTNLFFLHHSTGLGLIRDGNMRGVIANYNATHGTAFAFWDHDYNWTGLTDPNGTALGVSYEIPGDNTDPDGLYYLWTSGEADAVACRSQILNNHQLIAFKSCFPASAIPDAATLNQYKAWYLGMRAVFDQYPNRLFVVMSTPPLHRLATTETEAANARAFANWLSSQEFLGGRANLVCFNLFNYLAGADNMLKYEYEIDHNDADSHPNEYANQVVGPILANFFIQSALNFNPGPPPALPVPIVRANDATGAITIAATNPVTITVELEPGGYAGTPADWWIIAAPQTDAWYYFGGDWQWHAFSPANLSECVPAYQGGLATLPACAVLESQPLPGGVYTVYFAVDQMDGVVNYPAGPIVYDAVIITVEE